MNRFFRTLTCIALTLGSATAALAQYPDRSVRIVVPFGPGGNIDMTARKLTAGMSAALGQPVIVENKPGAGGLLGAEMVARATPDGYTLLLASTGSLAAAPALYPNLGFDPIKDLATSRAVTSVPLVLVTHPSIEAKSVAELIALAKQRKEPLAIASTGNGTSNHLTAELFQKMAGVRLLHIPYKGSAQALTDLIGGQVDLMFDNLPTSLPLIRSGKLRALGVTSAQRSSTLPELPTIAESGLPGFQAGTFTGIVTPAGVPDAIADRIDDALRKTLHSTALKAEFSRIGADVVDVSPADFAKLMRDEGRKWSTVVREAGVKLD